MNSFLYDKNLRHESVNAFLLACIYLDIFLDYDKIIDIYASKYQRRMLLFNQRCYIGFLYNIFDLIH